MEMYIYTANENNEREEYHPRYQREIVHSLYLWLSHTSTSVIIIIIYNEQTTHTYHRGFRRNHDDRRFSREGCNGW